MPTTYCILSILNKDAKVTRNSNRVIASEID